jgi:hypothetical protein
MLLKTLIRWGAWPAVIVGALALVSGINMVTTAQTAIVARPAPAVADDPLANLDLALMAFLGTAFVVAGVVTLVAAGLTRLKNRILSMVGIVACFFLAGLMGVNALTSRLAGLPLAVSLVGMVCLLLAGGTGVAARSADGEATKPTHAGEPKH